jgi:hypothetical protein
MHVGQAYFFPAFGIQPACGIPRARVVGQTLVFSNLSIILLRENEQITWEAEGVKT